MTMIENYELFNDSYCFTSFLFEDKEKVDGLKRPKAGGIQSIATKKSLCSNNKSPVITTDNRILEM